MHQGKEGFLACELRRCFLNVVRREALVWGVLSFGRRVLRFPHLLTSGGRFFIDLSPRSFS